MLIFCISSSNIKHSKGNSTSLKICNEIRNMAFDKCPEDVIVEIIHLVDYDFKPCIGCGSCFKGDECIHDEDFNIIYRTLSKGNAFFIISPHYAPIPAKLTMLLEKLEQLAFLKRFNDEKYRSPLYQKPVGIVAHGGGTEEICRYYKGQVIDTIRNALSYPIEMKIVNGDSDSIKGVIVPVKNVQKVEGTIFPKQEYDWNDINKRITPLVDNVIKEMKLKLI